MSPLFKIGIVNKLFKKLDEDSIFHIFDIVKYKNWYSPKKTFYSPLILRNNP